MFRPLQLVQFFLHFASLIFKKNEWLVNQRLCKKWMEENFSQVSRSYLNIDMVEASRPTHCFLFLKQISLPKASRHFTQYQDKETIRRKIFDSIESGRTIHSWLVTIYKQHNMFNMNTAFDGLFHKNWTCITRSYIHYKIYLVP